MEEMLLFAIAFWGPRSCTPCTITTMSLFGPEAQRRNYSPQPSASPSATSLLPPASYSPFSRRSSSRSSLVCGSAGKERHKPTSAQITGESPYSSLYLSRNHPVANTITEKVGESSKVRVECLTATNSFHCLLIPLSGAQISRRTLQKPMMTFTILTLGETVSTIVDSPLTREA